MFSSPMLKCAVAAPAAEPDARRALEILRSNCQQCHMRTMALSGLDLTSREGLLKGGSRGPAISAGNSAESRLIEAVERQGKLIMPPAAPLATAEIGVLKRWIDQGAEWPVEAAPSVVAASIHMATVSPNATR